MGRITLFLIACAVAFVSALGSVAHAQQADYPTRPIKLVVPYPAGGPADFVGRTLADSLRKTLKQPVVIENKSGATGVIGSDSVAKSQPDGYTLLLGLMGPLSIAPVVLPTIPYDPLRDFEPVRLVATMPEILVANPKRSWTSLAELIAEAKKNPGRLTIASAGVGSLPHLAAEQLKRETGIDMLHVPYRGAAPAVTDILGGQVDVMFADGPAVLPQIQGGLLNAVVVTADERLPVLPGVQTAKEAGFTEVRAENWYGVLVPRGTSPQIVDRLQRAVADGVTDPDVQQAFAKLGVYGVRSSDPDTFRAFLKVSLEKWGGLAKAVGAKIE